VGRVYAASDRELGRIVDAYRSEPVLVVSDHGGGPSSDWVLFMNHLLAAEGFLALERGGRRKATATAWMYGQLRKRLAVPVRRRLQAALGGAKDRAVGAALYGDVDWARSRAYAHMQAAVRVNLAGREASGTVPSTDRKAVVDEGRKQTGPLRLPSAEPALTAVYRAEALQPDEEEEILDRLRGLGYVD